MPQFPSIQKQCLISSFSSWSEILIENIDGCSLVTNSKLLNSKGSALVPAKNTRKISKSRGSGIRCNSDLALVLPTSSLWGVPKAHVNDKASSITKSRVCQVHAEDQVTERVVVSSLMQKIRGERTVQALIWLWGALL